MNPLERMVTGAAIGLVLVVCGAIAIGLAHICTPGEMLVLALVFVGLSAFVGWSFGEQERRNDEARAPRRDSCQG